MKYSIGIDLGTTNCALAYVPLAPSGAESKVLAVAQWESPGTLAEHETLPSFLYLPADSEKASFPSEGETTSWITGAFARKQAADRPGAVAHSAKSWLCHHAVDRTQPILPWGSTEVATDEKISPIQASAFLLNYLRHAWNTTLAAADPDAAFDAQQITVTVPASFDAVAQRLTLEAATAAGFPEGIRLLEEPQAAFYRWLEQHPEAGALREKLPRLASTPQHVLVVDIGGGTSDFSLFEIQRTEEDALPDIKRVAVSDHILLGGDNVDLALAHLVEPRFSAGGEPGSLTAKQWNYLVARCRDLKERILAESDNNETPSGTYTVSVPGAGSSLIAGTQSADIKHEEIIALLFDGFFPRCQSTDKPEQPRAALRELGLPYAADSAITRHLAAFLDGRPTVDAILFNGGTLFPEKLRRHLSEQIASWQDNNPPALLDNPEPDLAVARGAAHYGALFHTETGSRIEAGAARAVYLEVAAASSGKRAGERSLVCILPRGAQPEQEIVISKPELRLRLNRKVEFQPWYSTRHEGDKPGKVIPWTDSGFHSLPPLHTTAELPAKDKNQISDDARIPVSLSSKLNAVGLLNVACVSADDRINRSWPLEFNLQTLHQQSEPDTSPPSGEPPGDTATPEPNVDPETLSEAAERITTLLQNPPSKRDPVTPSRLLKSLEKILGLPKHQWNGALVRGLWPAFEQNFDSRATSIDHEETWLSCSGFMLRPGYGAALDESRINALWRLHETGLAFPNKRINIQAYVLWRRVAGGLNRTRQTALLEPELARLRDAKNPPADLVRLAGALERLDPALKRELATLFLEKGAALAREGGHASPYFAALTSLLSRTPLYAGPETILPPEAVEEAFEATRDLDWAADSAKDITTLFLRAARLTGDRHLDVPRATGKQIQSQLEKAGVAPPKLHPLREVVAIAQADRALLFGESLPPGISLG